MLLTTWTLISRRWDEATKKTNEDTYKKYQDLYEVLYMKEVQELVFAVRNKKQKKDQAVQAATV